MSRKADTVIRLRQARDLASSVMRNRQGNARRRLHVHAGDNGSPRFVQAIHSNFLFRARLPPCQSMLRSGTRIRRAQWCHRHQRRPWALQVFPLHRANLRSASKK